MNIKGYIIEKGLSGDTGYIILIFKNGRRKAFKLISLTKKTDFYDQPYTEIYYEDNGVEKLAICF